MSSIYFGDCPYGGHCIDPGNPSDCAVNNVCFNFKSAEERQEFDKLPDKFETETGLKFKNETQLKFFLTDFPKIKWRTVGGKFTDTNPFI